MGGINYITSEVNAMRCIDPTFAHVEHIADNLREQDRLEVFYSHGLTGWEAVITSWKYSETRHLLEGDDGIPCAVCGVNDGHIWLLGTDSLTATNSHRRQLIRFGEAWIEQLLAGGEQMLHNWALSSNTKNIRFLKHLGFEIDPPKPMGQSCQLFNHFWRKA
jgi:hypothetical protein